MTQRSNEITIYPLFSFQISETQIPKTLEQNKDSNQFMEKIEEGFEFSNKVALRLIRKEEIDKFRRIFPPLWRDGAYLISLINAKTFVFEVRDGMQTTDRLVYEALLAMRLHKTGSVFCKIAMVEKDSKIISFYTISPPTPYRPSKYELNINEIEEVDKWVNKINKLNLDNNTSFRVPLERFSRFHEERRIDDKIIDLAIAFEALFTGKDTPRLEHMGTFVGLGCSMLLGNNSEERNEIKQFMTKAFEIRNKIVHGENLKTPIEVIGKKYALKDFSVQLQTYLRDSIKKLI